MESRDVLANELSTIQDYLRWGVSVFNRSEIFFGHGTDNALDEALQLLQHALHLPPDLMQDVMAATLTTEERMLVLVLFDARVKERLPAPYLIGKAWFAGYSFKVDERVIIPRSPIAELIESGFQPWIGEHSVERVLDLCTGSGCIGIACALYGDDVQVDLVDISPQALEVAVQNIKLHALQGQVTARQSDLFEALDSTCDRYDLIVSNPPYVDKPDLEAMPAEFHHEPVLALEAGDDGLAICKQIFANAVDFLNPGGLLVMELGNSGMHLEERFPDIPFTWVEFARGGHGVLVMRYDELVLYGPVIAA